MRGFVGALVREPLVHFAVLGVALFALDAAVADGSSSAGAAARAPLAIPEGPIVVDDDVRARLASRWAQSHGAPPTPDVLERLVEGWIDEEVLYREGLALGLADDDRQVRDRVSSQMAYVLRSQIVVPEPSDEELRAWYREHRAELGEPDRIDFTRVFVQGDDEAAEARAAELLALLQAGADPGGLGDTHPGGRRFRGRRLEDLAARFGDAFVAGLDTEPLGTWVLRRSFDGFHLVRVDARRAATDPGFDAIRAEARHRWEKSRRETAMERAVESLRARYTIMDPS